MISQTQVSTAKFIARLIGPVFVVAAAMMIFNADAYRAIVTDFLKSPALIYVAGFLALLGGLAIVNVHNSWAREWPLFITVIGWLGVIGGIIRMALPQLIEALGTDIYMHRGFILGAGGFVLLIGGYISFKGYSA
jgi:uncharacterized membrane protein